MPAFDDTRPPGYWARFRPGNTFSRTLQWPAGALAGRTFSATLDAAALAVNVVGDAMTISATAAQTTTAGLGGHAFALVETTGGAANDLLVGTWVGSDAPNVTTSANLTVTIAGSTVTVDVDGAAHAGADAATAHGVVAHDWVNDGWTPFTPVTMTADGTQAFATSVSGGRGVVTGTQAGQGAHRVAYLRQGTSWPDGEVRSLIWGPTATWDGSNAQQGHLHRAREISPGLWEAIAVWTSVVFGGDYSVLHTAGVRFSGASTLSQSGGDASSAADSRWIDRAMRVRARQRFTFGQVFQDYQIDSPQHALDTLEVGDTINVEAMADTSFNETNVAINALDFDGYRLNVVDPAAGAPAAETVVSAGRVLPVGYGGGTGGRQKRWCPQWIATRVIGGTAAAATVEIKRWRYGEPEPSWADPRVRRAAVASNGAVPALALGPGLCGLWTGHFHDNSGAAWGAPVVFTRL